MSYNAVMMAANINQNRGFSNYPLKALQFHSFMWAAQDSGACLRKGNLLFWDQEYHQFCMTYK